MQSGSLRSVLPLQVGEAIISLASRHSFGGFVGSCSPQDRKSEQIGSAGLCSMLLESKTIADNARENMRDWSSCVAVMTFSNVY